ncbi:MAG: nucleotidyltransferase [Kiritimatiellia bacterium]|nr:nucleotidyltransferase [Kiritimatiellia bacterium]
MDEQALPGDFKEFLKLLNEAEIQYLMIGGYAVGYHGYPRATADMDIWVAISPDNASKLVHVFRQFGMQDAKLSPALFQERGKIIRMGVPPMRIEVLTDIDGVAFDDCYAARITTEIDGQMVQLISLEHLRMNKKAAGRHKDMDDLEHLPDDSTANQRMEETRDSRGRAILNQD